MNNCILRKLAASDECKDMATQIYWSRQYNDGLLAMGDAAPPKGKYLSPEFGEWVCGHLAQSEPQHHCRLMSRSRTCGPKVKLC